MPRYVIERQYLVPVYEHILVEAPTFEAACQSGIDETEQPWGDTAQVDYECARCTTIERVVQLPVEVSLDGQAGDALERPLSYFLYDAGLDPLPIPADFAEDGEVAPIAAGFV